MVIKMNIDEKLGMLVTSCIFLGCLSVLLTDSIFIHPNLVISIFELIGIVLMLILSKLLYNSIRKNLKQG